ncbi:acetyltransferase [Kitasatospora sp. NPDC048540]|uniref:acetyltransferase n=1 Tax=unclassified Kitasatospora TaxID=2633591 RepID=UPI000B08760D|nr:acetyltransferase [Kitasatospora sp. MBT63]
MTESLWIAGAGGVGREALDTALAAGVPVAGFLDDRAHGGTVRGLPVLAPDRLPAGARYLVGIADPAVRRRLAALLDGLGGAATTLVHPRALIAPETELGPGCLVMGGAYVSSGVRLGAHSQVHYNATVGHDSVLGERVTVYPGGNVSGSVLLEDDTTVGSNAVVLQGRKVGRGAFVGAAAVVTRDVAADTVVVGTPARQLRRSDAR